MTIMPDPTLDDRILRLDHHLERVRECERSWRHDPLPTATPKNARYPLVYPRDTAALVRAYDRLDRLGQVSADHASAALRGAASFACHVQSDDGCWGQRYDLDGHDRSIYLQEDNTAHALALIARHVRHARRKDPDDPSPREEDAFDALERGWSAARRCLLDDELGLYWSTTSVHESRVETGWTLWTNGAYHAALRLCADAARSAGQDPQADRWDRDRERLEHALREHLVHDGRYVRRLTPQRRVDDRADVTLLAPSYFGFADLDSKAEEAAVRHIEQELWDKELDLLQRYPSDHDDMGIHLHGGTGPYLSFSSWLAQRHAHRGHHERARDLLHHIARYATKDGDLPEHVGTLDQFTAFMDTEFLTGLDFRKEFDDQTLVPHVGHATKLQEAQRMTSAYADAVEAAEDAGDGVIRLAFPHAWTHAEFALALAMNQN